MSPANLNTDFLDQIKEYPPEIGGGGTNRDLPPKGYGGGGDPGDADERLDIYRDRLKRCRFGIGLSLVSVTMLFVALTVIYMARQHSSVLDENGVAHSSWLHIAMPPILLLNTIILLLSSATLEVARRKIRWSTLFAPLSGIPGVKLDQPRSLPWLAITLVLGFGFLTGQAVAWRALVNEGFYLRGNPSSAFFYLLTGAHAVHLSVGLIALSYASLANLISLRLESRCLIVDVTSWYWHFMTLLWLYIYAVLMLSA
jgi:cytochrome c oxidase subunit 3